MKPKTKMDKKLLSENAPVFIDGSVFLLGEAVQYAQILANDGKHEAAARVCNQILRIHPRHSTTAFLLGSLFLQTRQPLPARPWLELASNAMPSQQDAQLALLHCLLQLDDLKAAEPLLRRMIQAFPGCYDAHYALAVICARTQRKREAEALYHAAIRVSPLNAAHCWAALAALFDQRGAYAEAFHALDNALRATHTKPETWQFLLFLSNAAPTFSASEIAALHQRYAASLDQLRAEHWTPYPHSKDPARQLEIGFVSGDMHSHPVGYFMEALLAHLNPESFRVTIYSSHEKGDAQTSRLRSLPGTWHDCYKWSDARLLTQIKEDEIDVLIDLSGLTTNNRLMVFACKPAPLQVSYLGYFATTGLTSIDYILGNQDLLPNHEAHLYSEKLWHLPNTYLCYTPPLDAPEPSVSPVLRRGVVTFGSFCKLIKLTDTVLSTWCQILLRSPQSELYIKLSGTYEESVLNRLREKFTAQGIAHWRIKIENKSNHSAYLAAYANIDITLDTFPYNGGTTTTDSLWMGVPVLTVKGDRYVAHMSEAILNQVGMEDWVAQSIDEYIDLAVALSTRPEALATLRSSLRGRMLASTLTDAPRFAENFGSALRQMWERWCMSESSPTEPR